MQLLDSVGYSQYQIVNYGSSDSGGESVDAVVSGPDGEESMQDLDSLCSSVARLDSEPQFGGLQRDVYAQEEMMTLLREVLTRLDALEARIPLEPPKLESYVWGVVVAFYEEICLRASRLRDRVMRQVDGLVLLGFEDVEDYRGIMAKHAVSFTNVPIVKSVRNCYDSALSTSACRLEMTWVSERSNRDDWVTPALDALSMLCVVWLVLGELKLWFS